MDPPPYGPLSLHPLHLAQAAVGKMVGGGDPGESRKEPLVTWDDPLPSRTTFATFLPKKADQPHVPSLWLATCPASLIEID